MLSDKYIQELDANFNTFKIQQNINIQNRIKINKDLINKLTSQTVELQAMLSATNKLSQIKGIYNFTFSNISEFTDRINKLLPWEDGYVLEIPCIGPLWIENDKLATQKKDKYIHVPFMDAFNLRKIPDNLCNSYLEINNNIELYIDIDIENKKAILLSKYDDITIPITRIKPTCILTQNIYNEYIYEFECECKGSDDDNGITCQGCKKNGLQDLDKCVCQRKFPTVTYIPKFKYTVDILTYEIKLYIT